MPRIISWYVCFLYLLFLVALVSISFGVSITVQVIDVGALNARFEHLIVLAVGVALIFMFAGSVLYARKRLLLVAANFRIARRVEIALTLISSAPSAVRETFVQDVCWNLYALSRMLPHNAERLARQIPFLRSELVGHAREAATTLEGFAVQFASEGPTDEVRKSLATALVHLHGATMRDLGCRLLPAETIEARMETQPETDYLQRQRIITLAGSTVAFVVICVSLGVMIWLGAPDLVLLGILLLGIVLFVTPLKDGEYTNRLLRFWSNTPV